MIEALIVLLAISAGLLLYIYVGYLLALKLIVGIRGPRRIRRSPITPPVTLVISAFNEAAVMRKKIENALALDYPVDRREILVVSDASDDGTDEIVREYAPSGVRLFRQAERRGKTAGLNAALPTTRGAIVVFSDANSMYREDALRMLVRNFADPAVGCVTGEARYIGGGNAVSDLGERMYWGYEMQIKRQETALGSMVGGDGAIYAIRKSLWKPLPENAINDFLNPLQIVAGGWRAVYEPEAVCYEETAGGTRAEYRRRVRIVSRSWRAIFQAGPVLNPFRVGLFSWSILSHKVLRWLSGLFGATAAVAALALSFEAVQRWPTTGTVALLVASTLVLSMPVARRGIAMFGYFAVINAASLVGMVKGSLGRVSGVWLPPRARTEAAPTPGLDSTIPVGLLLASAVLLTALTVTLVPAVRSHTGAVIFWTSAAILVYVYVLYPALLAILRPFARRAVAKADIEPTVCLFIPANNEAAVLDAKLRNALALDYPSDRLDIVVASDGSTDATGAIARRFGPRVRLVEFSPRRGKVTAINRGLRSVTSEIVVFSDANTFLEPGALRAILRNFADPTVGAASGDVALVGERAALARSEDLYYMYERWVQRAESDIGSMIGADGALYGIRRELFAPPADDTILDDMAIPMAIARMGYRVVFEPEARAYEQGSDTALEEFARKSRVIAGAIQLMTRRDSGLPLRAPQLMFSFLSHKALRWLSPVFATCAFLTSLGLAGTSAFYTATSVIQGLVFAGGVAGCFPLLRRANVVAITHYFCLVQAAAAVGFFRGVTGRQSVLWRRFLHEPVDGELPYAG